MLRTTCLFTGLFMCSALPAFGQQRAPLIIFVSDAETGAIQQTIALPGFPNIYSPEISPDSRYVGMDGFHEGEGWLDAHVLIVDLETGELSDLGPGAMPSWSPDGEWIAISKYQPRGVYIRSVNGTEERMIERGGWGIQWSPDGKKLAYDRGGNLIIYDLDTETASAVFPEDDVPYEQIYWNCGWSPDSDRIAFKARRSDGTAEMAVVTVTGDDPQLTVECRAESIAEDFAWHPDGSQILIQGPDPEIRRSQMIGIDPNGDADPVRWPRQPADRHNGGMSFSRDGKLLVYMSRD